MKKVILSCVFLAFAIMFASNICAQDEQEIKQMKRQVQHLREMARQAMDQGREEQARELMEKAEDLLMELRDISSEEEGENGDENIEELMAEAEEAEREGDYDRAEDLWQEAKELKKRSMHGEEKGRFERGEMYPEKQPFHENKPGKQGYRNHPRVKKLFAFLKEYAPQRLEKLKQLEEESPKQFLRELRASAGEIRELEELKKEQPERFKEVMKIRKLDVESWKLAESYQREKDFVKKTQIKQKLQMTLKQIFELKIKGHEKEIADLAQELERLKQRIAKRTENKERIIDKRVKEMIGEEEEFEWGD